MAVCDLFELESREFLFERRLKNRDRTRLSIVVAVGVLLVVHLAWDVPCC